jgi:hypothetical protein
LYVLQGFDEHFNGLVGLFEACTINKRAGHYSTCATAWQLPPHNMLHMLQMCYSNGCAVADTE